MADYTLKLSFNANGGYNAPQTVTQTVSSTAATVTVTAQIPSQRPLKTGYTFLGWSGNSSTYQPNANVSKTFTRQFDDQGNIVSQSANIYFSAMWAANTSYWGSVPSSVMLDGSTSYTFNVNKAATVDHHSVVFQFGDEALEYENVGTSVSATFPLSWCAEIPNNTSGTITASLTSYNANGIQIGNPVTMTLTGNVPSTVVPTLSITHTRINSNATINGWNVLVQGFSAISFTASASGAGGSTVSSISFTGAGLQQTGTATTAQSSVLNVTGSQTWTVTVTDSRGRTETQTYTETVYAYTPPSISTATARRCNSNGTINEATGTYALFNSDYSFSSVNGHNVTTQTIDYKLHTGSTWTNLANSYTSGSNAVVGGSFAADNTYDIRLTITDSIGNTAVYSVFLASVQGFAIGLKNDRARFGGVPTEAGLVVDWDAKFKGTLTLGQTTLTEAQLIALLNMI